MPLKKEFLSMERICFSGETIRQKLGYLTKKMGRISFFNAEIGYQTGFAGNGHIVPYFL